MRVVVFVITLALLSALSGCATKHYGRVGVLTPQEKAFMNCREIELDIIRTQGFIAYIDKESDFSMRDIMAIFGDLWIGNAMEKSAAKRSAMERLGELAGLAMAKQCPGRTVPKDG
ncbi:MAG: hypothetical protein KIT73_14705 [Burkholderiales bacterium]|nr:hypothetical protein [Burkholderiales bacterium]